MLKSLFFGLLLLNSNFVLAQMTHSSVFASMKALNPAVISSRPAATFAAYIKNDKSVKDQDLSKGYGSGSYMKETGVLTSNNFFYGGKGGGITVEAVSDVAKGEIGFDFNLTNSTQGASSFEGEADTSFIGIGMGFGNFFGISFATSTFNMTSSFSTTVTAPGGGVTNISSSDKTKTTINRVRAGLIGNFGLDFGLYYESQSEKTTTESSQPEPPGGFDDGGTTSTVGVGVGHKKGNFHMEVFYEKRLEEQTELSGETYSPVRYGGTIETKLGSITIGYTGMYYIDGFSDLERVMYDNLIYGNSKFEARLENTINFSFGGDKGHSIGGSYSNSTVETETASKLGDGNLYTTITTVQSMAVSYRYSF